MRSLPNKPNFQEDGLKMRMRHEEEAPQSGGQ